MRTVLGVLFAGVIGFLSVAPGDALAGPRAGVAAAVRGRVTVDRTGAVGTAVSTGSPIFLNDQIKTGPDSGLQILLLDETVFTLGPDSAMRIDEFVYDPGSQEGSLDAELVRGAFRFISGRIAKGDPDKMKVRLPSGTIGIRGTIVDTRVDPVQGRALVVLAGPGEANTAGASAGHIRVDNAGVARDVMRSGWGVEIPDAGSPPSPPFLVPEEMFAEFRFEARPETPTKGSPKGSTRGDRRSGPASSRDPGPERGGDEADPDGLPPPAAPPPVGSAVGPPLPGPGFQEQLGETLGTVVLADPAQLPTEGMQATVTSIQNLVTLSGGFDGEFLYDLLDLGLQSGGRVDLRIRLDFNSNMVRIQLSGLESTLFNTMGMIGGGNMAVPFGPVTLGPAKYSTTFSYQEFGSSCMGTGACQAAVSLEFVNVNNQIAGGVKAMASVREMATGITEQIAPVDAPRTSISPVVPQ